MSLIVRSLTANDATAKFSLGTIYRDDVNGGKTYRYVRVEDGAVAVGDVLEYSDTSGNEVTKDRSGGSSVGRVVAGVALGTISDGYYGWIQVGGRNASVKTDGGVSAGDPLVPHASVDGQADTATSGSTVVITAGQVFGMALETDDGTTSAGTCAAILNCI